MVPICAILQSTVAMYQLEWPYLCNDVTHQALNFCNIFVVKAEDEISAR